MKPHLPEGFTIETTEYGGTGHGDERFGLTLYRWESRRQGLFRRRTVWGWREISTRWSTSSRDKHSLLIMANLLAKSDPQ